MAITKSIPFNREEKTIVFIGGGNMATAVLSGLIGSQVPATAIYVVEPDESSRLRLETQFGVNVSESNLPEDMTFDVVIWAVKPQLFGAVADSWGGRFKAALHISVAAGICCNAISDWVQTKRVVRCMPNTPALIGKGVTALFAASFVEKADRLVSEQILSGVGSYLWVQEEGMLDAVTALSGAGPAYVFYFLESMIAAGARMGLSQDIARKLAIDTFVGASELAATSNEPPATLRARVTSKGGATFAATSSMDQHKLNDYFVTSIEAAWKRSTELGKEFG